MSWRSLKATNVSLVVIWKPRVGNFEFTRDFDWSFEKSESILSENSPCEQTAESQKRWEMFPIFGSFPTKIIFNCFMENAGEVQWKYCHARLARFFAIGEKYFSQELKISNLVGPDGVNILFAVVHVHKKGSAAGWSGIGYNTQRGNYVTVMSVFMAENFSFLTSQVRENLFRFLLFSGLFVWWTFSQWSFLLPSRSHFTFDNEHTLEMFRTMFTCACCPVQFGRVEREEKVDVVKFHSPFLTL